MKVCCQSLKDKEINKVFDLNLLGIMDSFANK